MASPALNRAELLERVDGDLELLAQLVELFNQALPDQLREIDAAIAGNDSLRLSRQAHSLKGALLNLAAAPCSELAHRLEEMGRKNDLTGAVEIFAQLRSEIARLNTALAAEVAATAG
jgi:HPt (histidine-containing phosphotransfer) domain-containing protein